MNKVKNENQILIMLAFFSISIGLWENFRQLWLESNNFSPVDISTIISIGTFVSVVGIIFAGKYIKLEKLKTFVTCSLLIKFLNLFLLLSLNNSTNILLINFSIIIDVLTGYLVTTSIYPLITTIVKNDKVYSKRKLTEYLFKDVGILIGGLLIGKKVLGVLINYNLCLFISIIFLGIAIIVIINMPSTKLSENKQKEDVQILKYILKNKIQAMYIVYSLIGAIAFSTALGLKMITFTNYLNFTDRDATNYFLIVGLIADGIGILALKYLTPKNDYITITIKFGIRFFAYAIAFFANNTIIALIAITWSLLISTAYENITDGCYINRISAEYQLRYTNIRYVVNCLGGAIGVYLCGIMYEIGLKYMLGLSAAFMILQIRNSLLFNLFKKKRKVYKMKYVGDKDNNIEYRKRPGAYSIIIRKEDNKIGIVTDGNDYFYLGGGIENEETQIEALNRELIEKSGYTIKNVKKFDEVGSYIFADEKGYLEVEAYVYISEFDTKVTEPIEKDHKVLWVNPNDYVGKMCREWQEYILKEYIEKYYNKRS